MFDLTPQDSSHPERFNYLTLLVDSGASHHICNLDQHYFTRLTPCDLMFTTANGGEFSSKQIGDLLYLKRVCLTDAIISLASVPRFCDDGHVVVFNRTDCRIFSNASYHARGSPLFTAHRVNDAYLLKLPLNSDVSSASVNPFQHRPPLNSAMVADARVMNRCAMWHQRLNHMNLRSMRKLRESKAITDMRWSTEEESAFISFICPGCAKGKMKRKPTFKSNPYPQRKIKGPGDLLFIDLYFSNIPSLKGHSVGLIIVDAHSRCAWTQTASSKDQAAVQFKTWLDYMSQLRVPISHFTMVRSDNGGEFVGDKFLSILTSYGIQPERSPPKAHVHVAERHIGLMKESMRSLIQAAYTNLSHAAEWLSSSKTSNPFVFWPEAARHACAVANTLPFSDDGQGASLTKHEMFFGTHPDYSRFKVFGCTVYVLNYLDDRETLDNTSTEAIYLGFDPIVPHTWRVLKINTKRIVNSKHCVFNENLDLQSIPVFNKHLHQSYHYWSEDPDTLGEYVGDIDAPDAHRVPWHLSSVRAHLLQESNSATQIAARQALAMSIVETSPLDSRCPKNIHEALSSPVWKASLQRETDSLAKNNIIEFVVWTSHMKVFDITYVWKIKNSIITGLKTYKTRACFRGDRQREGIDYDETFSPVVRLKTLRTILAISTALRAFVHHMDVDTAFLYGEMTEEEATIYIKIPVGYPVPSDIAARQANGETFCGKLLKALYGLKQAPRLWNKNIDAFLKSIGFEPLLTDSCLYRKSSPMGYSYIAVFVDDLVISAPTEDLMTEIKNALKGKYNMKDLGPISECLGMRITYDQPNGTMTLDQTDYIVKMLEHFDMKDLRQARTPLDPGTKLSISMAPATDAEKTAAAKFPYREIIGKVMYLMLCTRPDIAFAVSFLSKFNSCHGSEHHKGVIHLMRYLMTTKDMCITYGQQPIDLMGFSDASWGADVDTRRSVTGYVFFIAGGPISWKSKQQTTVALSSAEAEYMALCDAAKEAIHLRWLVQDISPIYKSSAKPAIIFEDNTACIALASNPVMHERTKHIDMRYHFVRERIISKEIYVHYLGTDLMIADLLTKTVSVQVSNALLPRILGCMDILRHVAPYFSYPSTEESE